uniref:Uncharacterized protein n=1 Tax=Romanomermis culicivorax TaxID=13658 RepID=A0A915L0Y5_ROMCU
MPGNPIFVPGQVQYVDLYGQFFDGAPVTAALMTTSNPLTADNAIFYVKATGKDPSGMAFQRYSYTPYSAFAIDALRTIQVNGSSCGAGKFDCTGFGGPCVDISAYHDCVAQCPNGADEGCIAGYSKCSCVCVPYGSTCVSKGLLRLCTYGNNSQYFRCDNGDCVPSQWQGDGFNDCGDYSDEGIHE